MEENITATAILCCAAQCFNRAAADIIRFAKTPEEHSEMLRKFESEICELDNVAQEQWELMRAIADSADWNAILSE